jgi:GMP reductase
MKIEQDIKLDFKDVLIKPKRSTLNSRSEVILERKFKFKYYPKEITCVPIISANMDTTGTFEIANVLSQHKCLTAIHKHYSINDWKKYIETLEEYDNLYILDYVIFSIGIGDKDYEKLCEFTKICSRVDKICIDVANGYTENFVQFCKKIRNEFPDYLIMAGNLVTAEMTEQLILNGVDICKIGIGPSAVCTTRKQAGVGMPQLSAVIECSDAAHGLSGHVISDGGITCPGDASKAFGGGADFIMIGSLFAAHDESGGELIEDAGKKYKLFYGMSSDTAMKKYSGGVANYRSSEGRTVKLPYRGPLEGTILDLLGGIRSTCTYVGAKELKELSKRTTFIRVNTQLNTIYVGNEHKID